MTARRKSAFSISGECVEAGNGYRKSSHSTPNGECVEAGNGSRVVLVRDTTDRGGPVLTFSAGAWAEFTSGLSGCGS